MIHRVRQTGFSAGKSVLIIAAVAVLGVVSWGVYQNNRTQATNALANSGQVSSQSQAVPQPTVGYLAVKEWGVKLALSSAISDAYYVVPVGMSLDADGRPSGVIVGLTSLNASCGVVTSNSADFSKSVGEIVRALPTDKDPVSGRLYTQLLPNGVTINGYYYGFSANVSGKTCASQATLQAVGSAFANATKSAVL